MILSHRAPSSFSSREFVKTHIILTVGCEPQFVLHFQEIRRIRGSVQKSCFGRYKSVLVLPRVLKSQKNILNIFILAIQIGTCASKRPFRPSVRPPSSLPPTHPPEDLMPRDIMSSWPGHWMVFGQLVMPAQCCAEAPAAAVPHHSSHRHDQLDKHHTVPWLR